MTQITKTELVQILENINTPTFVGMVTDTPIEMKKFLDYWIINEEGKKKKNPNPTPNPYFESGIRKVSKKYKIITGFDYENSINRRLENEGKEGNFESSENWFEFVSKGLVRSKSNPEKYYFRYQYQNDSTTESTSYFEGNPIDKVLYESYCNQVTDYYKSQGLENPLMFQVCSLDNIKTISINKEQYEIVG